MGKLATKQVKNFIKNTYSNSELKVETLTIFYSNSIYELQWL